MKRAVLAIVLIVASMSLCLAEEDVSPDVSNLLSQARLYSDQGKAEEAITCLDGALTRYKVKSFDRYALLNYKFELLTNLSRFREANAVCVEKANIVTSPRQALLVADSYIGLNESEHALDWLEKSVDRGLLSYTIFADAKYDPLRGNKRFAPLVEIIKKKNGIGLPARSFSCSTILGKKVSTDMFRGKVLLVDFWATWCPPCMKQMPFIKKYYNEFKEKNFMVIGVAEEAKMGKLKEYLQANAVDWPMVANDQGKFDELAALYGVKNIPASFLIDKRGVLRHVNLAEDDLRNAILALTDETI
jgi:peroxiredoxin